MVCYKASDSWNSRVTPLEHIAVRNSITQAQKEKSEKEILFKYIEQVTPLNSHCIHRARAYISKNELGDVIQLQWFSDRASTAP